MERSKLEAIVGKLLAVRPMSRAAMSAKRKLERQAMKSKVTREP